MSALKADYEEKLAALESKFNAMFVEQKQVIEKLSKSAPAPAKTKFSKPVVKEVKSVNNKMNVLDIVRASANN